MKKNNILLLNSFSKKEINAFSRFIDSAYFNTDKKLSTLWQLLKKHIINKRELDNQWQQKIYDEIYQTKNPKRTSLALKEKNIFNAKLSLLVGLARRFLVIEGLETKQTIKNRILYEELLNKKQFDMMYRHISKEKITLHQRQLKDIGYHENAFRIERSLLNYLHQRRMLVKEDNIAELNFQLDMQYIIQKLQVQITALSLKRVSDKKDFDFSSMEAIQPLIKLPQYASQALIILDLIVIELMKNDKETTYYRLLEYLDNYESGIATNRLNDFYKVASNFCIRKIRKGELQYNRHQYELYKLMNDKNLLVEGGLMDIRRLKNIVILSCKMKDFSWAKELVNKYKTVISHKDEKSVTHFNLGVITFYEANYQEAISHFIRVKKLNENYDIDVRMMLAKSHYELDQEYDERTVTIFRSTERFVSNHKTISNQHKTGFKNFVRILIKIYKFRYRIGKATSDKMSEEISRLEFISDKKWLVDKLEEL